MNLPRPAVSMRQLSLLGLCPIAAASEALASAGADARGAVFTRREVVDFILDLTGFTADRPLHELRLLEPSFGDGDFLLPAIQRLLAAWNSTRRPGASALALSDAIRAVELHRSSFESTRAKVVALLESADLPAGQANTLADQWLICGDFLLVPLDGAFDVVAGNPPYVRQELIPDALMAEYRARYQTVYDRADLYVPFIERSLTSLAAKGALGFICADRWMKNRYGGPLRKLVADHFHLRIHVDMSNTPAFHSEVVAYPAITIISREAPGATRIARQPQIARESLKTLAVELMSDESPERGGAVRELWGVASGPEPWILESSDQLALVRRLESAFPTLEEAGCKVGIGVATGADRAFIGPFDELDVEFDRKLPLAMTRDIVSGEVSWRGLGVVNPFADEGSLVDLRDYPRLQRYLLARKDDLLKRHVAQKTPANWYRTIDRVYPALAAKPKLLIPDIKGEAQVVFEEGRLYPHHNLYYITTDTWDLKALQAVLLSGIAKLFVSIYSTRMRGGYLRFQAQYLRRIRVPLWGNVPVAVRRNLIAAAARRDVPACNRAVFALYGLSQGETAALEGNGD